MKSVKSIFEEAYQDALVTIPKSAFRFTQKNNDGVVKHYEIQPDQFKKALRNKFGDFENFSKIFSRHLLVNNLFGRD